MTKPYPKPRLQSDTTLVVLVGAGPGSPKDAFFGAAPQTRPRSAFTVCEVDPNLAVRTSVAQPMTAILAASLWHKGGFKTRPYKLRERDALPVRGLRDACHSDCPRNDGIIQILKLSCVEGWNSSSGDTRREERPCAW
jgi:hypothetical protein